MSGQLFGLLRLAGGHHGPEDDKTGDEGRADP